MDLLNEASIILGDLKLHVRWSLLRLTGQRCAALDEDKGRLRRCRGVRTDNGYCQLCNEDMFPSNLEEAEQHRELIQRAIDDGLIEP